MENLKAILWDYDGTLVDSTRKNMAVTVDVLRFFYPDIDSNLPEALLSIENYQQANYKYKNWRELYHECYHIPEDRMDEAGRLWTPYQLSNKVVPDLFHGLEVVIPQLADYRMGICSQNSSENIRNVLKHYQINEYFQSVIGYDDIPIKKQKPEPDGFLKCIVNLGTIINHGTIIYIGDHSEDVTFGKNAEQLLRENGYDVSVICIAARYLNNADSNFSIDIGSWKITPDYIIDQPEELLKIIKQ